MVNTRVLDWIFKILFHFWDIAQQKNVFFKAWTVAVLIIFTHCKTHLVRNWLYWIMNSYCMPSVQHWKKLRTSRWLMQKSFCLISYLITVLFVLKLKNEFFELLYTFFSFEKEIVMKCFSKIGIVSISFRMTDFKVDTLKQSRYKHSFMSFLRVILRVSKY